MIAQWYNESLNWVCQANGLAFAARGIVFCIIWLGGILLIGNLVTYGVPLVTRWLRFVGIMTDLNRYPVYNWGPSRPIEAKKSDSDIPNVLQMMPDPVQPDEEIVDRDEGFDTYSADDQFPVLTAVGGVSDEDDAVSADDLPPLPPRTPRTAAPGSLDLAANPEMAKWLR